MKRYLSALLALLLALTAAPGLCSEEVTANETGTQLWSPLEAFPDEIVGVCSLISSASSDTYDFLVQDKSRTEEIASAYVRALEESGFYQCVKYKEYTSGRSGAWYLAYNGSKTIPLLENSYNISVYWGAYKVPIIKTVICKGITLADAPKRTLLENGNPIGNGTQLPSLEEKYVLDGVSNIQEIKDQSGQTLYTEYTFVAKDDGDPERLASAYVDFLVDEVGYYKCVVYYSPTIYDEHWYLVYTGLEALEGFYDENAGTVHIALHSRNHGSDQQGAPIIELQVCGGIVLTDDPKVTMSENDYFKNRQKEESVSSDSSSSGGSSSSGSSGSKSCGYCGGSGKVKCSFCYGRGANYQAGGGYKTCVSCSGSGYNRCIYCNGTGKQ